MRFTKLLAATFALVAPIAVGVAVTAGEAFSSGTEDQFTADDYTIDRTQAPGESALIVVTDPDGNTVDPGDYGDLTGDVAETLGEVSADDWEPDDPFGPDGPFGADGPWPVSDGEPLCYNPDAFGPGDIDITTGDPGGFAAYMGPDGEWIQEPAYVDLDGGRRAPRSA